MSIDIQAHAAAQAVQGAREPVLSARQLGKVYTDGRLTVPVLENVDFDVYPGEMVAIIGASGSGKSTLLHLLGMLDLPSSGQVRVGGVDTAGLSEGERSALRNRKLGFVYQFHHLLSGFTALDNVAMPLIVRRESRKLAREKAALALAQVGLAARAEHSPGQLSGGERQRVALARALVGAPACVLADEPTGNLDRQTADEVFDVLVRAYRESGTAFVIVTHDAELAGRADRRLMMKGGRLRRCDRLAGYGVAAMLIDTHCHLDAPELRPDRREVIAAAGAAGVAGIVIPAVARSNFNAVRRLAHAMPGGAYALGIHPLYVGQAGKDDLLRLRQELLARKDDPRLVAIGEIGLDFFVPGLAEGEARERQEYFYQVQLDLALETGLPVLLHVRRSQDVLLKHLRRRAAIGGIAHAFNGSAQQAEMFIRQGFALGIGGAMTYARALQIRRLAAAVPLAHLVLETDAPDIPPAWLVAPERRNTPAQVARIAAELAQLRGLTVEDVIDATGATACRVLPRLGRLLSAPGQALAGVDG